MNEQKPTIDFRRLFFLSLPCDPEANGLEIEHDDFTAEERLQAAQALVRHWEKGERGEDRSRKAR